jgi:hypothetical protein
MDILNSNDTLTNESLDEHRDIRQINNDAEGIKTVQFLPKRQWNGLRELGLVADEMGLPELVQETIRYLRWHRLSRRQTVR